MNREIKFRAWDKKDKKIFDVEVFDLNCGDVSKVCILRDEKRTKKNYWYAPKEVVLMQYTGLKDKNGKEIYEGDIVKTDEGFIGLVEFGRFPYVANIEDYGYFIKAHEYFKLTANTCQAVEVIGNIYESPQLLDNTDTKE